MSTTFVATPASVITRTRNRYIASDFTLEASLELMPVTEPHYVMAGGLTLTFDRPSKAFAALDAYTNSAAWGHR